jgi:MipA family protein
LISCGSIARRALRRGACAAAALTCVVAAPAQAEERERPRWEVGAGFSPIYIPDYRGSNQSHLYVLPVPYVVYRGDVLKVERQRIRGLIFGTDRAELDFSINASPPVRASRNDARRGMDDLDPVWELGPSLKFTLYEPADGSSDLSLRLPVRAAIASDLSRTRGLGFNFTPTLGIDWRDVNVLGSRGWNTGLLAGVVYGSRNYFEYFYRVDPRFATASRPAYEPGGGYGGWQLTGTFSKRWGRYWLGGFLRYDTVANAAFDASPLVRTNHTWWAGIAMAWVFWESDAKVMSKE